MIANVDNLNSLVTGIRNVLAPDGLFVFETQYGVDVTEKNLLDTVYHEHLSYFNIKPLQRFFARLGMELIDVQHIWTKGGSIRVTVQLAGGPRKPSADVARFIADEDRLGVDQPPYYAAYLARSPRSATSWWRWRTPATRGGNRWPATASRSAPRRCCRSSGSKAKSISWSTTIREREI